MECKVWSVKWGVWSVKCEVQSLECGVWSGSWSTGPVTYHGDPTTEEHNNQRAWRHRHQRVDSATTAVSPIRAHVSGTRVQIRSRTPTSTRVIRTEAHEPASAVAKALQQDTILDPLTHTASHQQRNVAPRGSRVFTLHLISAHAFVSCFPLEILQNRAALQSATANFEHISSSLD